MKMKYFARFAYVCAISLSAHIEAKFPLESRPNIIADAQGVRDLSCMANEIVKTSNIDRFDEESTRFTGCQVNPTCASTRAAIISGRAALKNGVTHTILQRERMALHARQLIHYDKIALV